MGTVLVILHVITCVLLIPVILLQPGKGGGMGSAFGGGSSTVFGGRGANTFLSTLTSVLAGAFMVLSVLITIVNHGDDLAAAGKKGKHGLYFDWIAELTKDAKPVAEGAEAKPTDEKKPAEAKPAEAKPAEEKKADEAKPAEEKKAEAKPADEKKPAEEKKPANP